MAEAKQTELGAQANPASNGDKGLLRFVTCGSVDDGKSTLIGHMLYDAKLVFADQIQALELDSAAGSVGEGELDYSLLLDGLAAEREQGITIDVAYRYFATQKRSFIVADCPGHEEYTRNMAVGASTSDLAVILVDATKGLLPQTYRHARICALMGVTHFVFTVNKMDLVEYAQECFNQIAAGIEDLMRDYSQIGYDLIPVSARKGDNVANPSVNMPWYRGPALLDYLESVDVSNVCNEQELYRTECGFTLPVQRVCRPDNSFRGYEGTVASGTIGVGDTVRILPSGTSSHVSSILVSGQNAQTACEGQAVTLCLDDELDISRGCVIEHASGADVSSLFAVTLLWMDDVDLVEGKSFFFRIGTAEVPGTVYEILHKVDVTTGDFLPARRIAKNEICACKVSLGHKVPYQVFGENRSLGSMVLANRLTNATAAAGVIEHKLNRSDNLTYHQMDVTRELREHQLGQRACTLWFTGLSGSGKSTLANALEKRLHALGRYTMLLDGDNVRLGLNRNLGFTEADRIENIRRIAEVAKLMNDAGLIVITSFISPFAGDRRNAAEIIGLDSFFEIYVSTPLEECERRDVKGLYAKARKGELANFTGISSPYEVPENPDLTIDTCTESTDDAIDRIVRLITNRLDDR